MVKEKTIFENLFGKEIRKIERSSLGSADSITNKVAFNRENIFKYKVRFSDNSNVDFIGKWKSKKIIFNGARLLSGGNPILFFALLKNRKILGFNKSNKREAILYKNIDKSLEQYLVPVIDTYQNSFFDKYFVALKEVKVNDGINKKNAYKIIDAITDFHAFYYNGESKIKPLCLNNYSGWDYFESKSVIRKMFNALADKNNQDYGDKKTKIINNFINNIENEYEKVSHRRTLTHNDFSDRNIFTNGNKVCFYDWEMACYQNPEHDLIEFLVSILSDMSDEDVFDIINYYKTSLSKKTKVNLSEEQYNTFLRFNILEYCANKLNILRIANRKLDLGFIETFSKNASRLMTLLKIGEENV